MRLVFLDFDGALNSLRYIYSHERPLPNQLDPYRVRLVDALCRETGAAVVVASRAWRINYQDRWHELLAVLRAKGLTAPVVGHTITCAHHRGPEIASWIALASLDTGIPVEDFRPVILDDDRDMEAMSPRMVGTRCRVGLQPRHVHKVARVMLRPLERSCCEFIQAREPAGWHCLAAHTSIEGESVCHR